MCGGISFETSCGGTISPFRIQRSYRPVLFAEYHLWETMNPGPFLGWCPKVGKPRLRYVVRPQRELGWVGNCALGHQWLLIVGMVLLVGAACTAALRGEPIERRRIWKVILAIGVSAILLLYWMAVTRALNGSRSSARLATGGFVQRRIDASLAAGPFRMVTIGTTDPRVQSLGLLGRYSNKEQLHHCYIFSDPVRGSGHP